MCKVLEEREFPITEFLPVASAQSVGKEIRFRGQTHKVIGLEDAVAAKPDIALFSAGASTSKEWAPRFAEIGTTVIDNSSAWRMDPEKKLVVPEINANELGARDKIIANPNCSTIQMVVALAPIHRKYKLKRLVISTYQSFTGTGMKAVKQYQLERKGFEPKSEEMAYFYPIFENCIPHCDVFLDNGYTKEEMKLVHETRKIMNMPELPITATAVRVPVYGGHSESVNAELEEDFELEDLVIALKKAPGLVVLDDINNHKYPMPLFARNHDDVFVGRVRRDESAERAVNLWVVADNLRKGAATNAVQIAEYLLTKKLVGGQAITA